jgi:pyrroloquinoline quinone biosynthesis protein B
VLEIIAANPIFGVLAPNYAGRVELPLDETITLASRGGAAGRAVRAFAVPGKVPLYLEEDGRDPAVSDAGDAVGLELREIAGAARFLSSAGARR